LPTLGKKETFKMFMFVALEKIFHHFAKVLT